MLDGIILGIKSFFRSFGAISKYGLWRYVFASGLLSALLGFGIFKLIWKQSDRLGDWASSFYKWDRGSELVASLSDWLIWIVLLIVSLLVFKYIMLILSAPIMSLVSEKIEYHGTGQKPPSFSIGDSIKSMIRGARVAVRNLSRELLFTGLLLLAGLIPLVGFISAALIFFVQAYYAGFGNCDFYMERHFSVRESVKFIRRNRGFAFANGAIFLGLLAIPVVGFIFAPILSAIGASLALDPKISPKESPAFL